MALVALVTVVLAAGAPPGVGEAHTTGPGTLDVGPVGHQGVPGPLQPDQRPPAPTAKSSSPVPADLHDPQGGGAPITLPRLPAGEGVMVRQQLPLPLPTPAATPTPSPSLGAGPPPSPRPANPQRVVTAALGRAVELFSDDDATTAAPTGRGVSEDTIRVGGVVSASLVDQDVFVSTCEGARARFERANRDGELSRTIEIIGCHDDTADVDLSNGMVASLVRQDAFAVVPLVSLAFDDDELLGRQRVPHVGWGGSPVFCGDGRSFALATTGALGCPVLEARGYVAVAGPVLQAALTAVAGDPGSEPWSAVSEVRIVHLVEDSAEGAALGVVRAEEAERLGVELVDTLAVLPPPTAAAPRGWSTAAAAVLALEPEVVLIEAPGHAGLYQALRNRGYRGEIVGVGNFDALGPDVDTRLAMTPSVQLTQGLDPLVRTGDAWTRVATDAFIAGVVGELDRSFLEGYLAADVFVRAAAATPEPFGAESFHDTVNRGWYHPGLGDIACGGWWPAAHVIEHPCVSAARFELLNDEPVQLFSQLRAPVWLRNLLEHDS